MDLAASINELETLDELLNVIPDSVVVVNSSSQITYVNSRTEELFGRSRKQLAELQFDSLIAPRHRKAVSSKLSSCLSGSLISPHTDESSQAVRKDGSVFPITIDFRNLRTHGNTSICCTIRDISDQKHLEEILRSQVRLLDVAHDAIIVRDLDGTIRFWNHGAELMYGWKSNEAVNQPTHKLLRTEFPVSLEDQQSYLFTHGKWEGALRHSTISGRRIVVASRWVLYKPEHSGENKILEINNDITEKVDAETKFESLLDAAPDPMVVVNHLGDIVVINDQAERLFGRTRKQLIGQSVEALVPTEFRKEYKIYSGEYYSSPRVTRIGQDLEIFVRHKDGRTVPVEVSLAPLNTLSGVLFTAAIRDVTQRKRNEQEIKQLNITLEKRNRELSDSNNELESFSYSVSHDLRAPLRAIDGFSQALEQDWGSRLDDEARHHLRRIRAGVTRMGLLIDDMLTLARVVRHEIIYDHFDLSKMAKEICVQLQVDDPNRVAEFSIQPGLMVDGDRILLRAVMENLLGNAWKFTSKTDNAKIEIGLQTNTEQKIYFVRDNGAGFDMKYADKLFGVFQRLHHERDFPGTGVGLATVQRIIQRHGGNIWAHSTLEAGATFYFSFTKGTQPKNDEHTSNLINRRQSR